MLKILLSSVTLSIRSLLAWILVCCLFLSPIANADSPADDDIHILDSIYVGGAGDSCEQQVRTMNWSDQNWWKSTWNYQNNYSEARTDTDAFIEEFNTNQEAGSGWAVMRRANPNNGSLNMITIQTFSPNATLTVQDGGRLISSSQVRSLDIFLNPGSNCRLQNYNAGAVNVSSYGNSIAGEYGYLFVASDNIVYPSGYAGEQIPTSNEHADLDGDGLNAAQETTQGTSNANKDTDGDGLNDYIESQWYSIRSDVFCGSQCAYPNPLTKDIYIELDWMHDSGFNRTFKPSNTQLALVEDGLNDQGYDVHIDTGQYGGGNQLSNYVEYLPFSYGSNPVGFFDLKNGNTNESIAANFATNRDKIWRYFVSGYGLGEDHTVSGASYAGSDNIFVSTGYIEDHQTGYGYTDVDTAIAGTIVHEVGHSLCMSQTQKYSYQSNNCQYSGVDTAAVSTYDSVLNYNLQMFQNTLSDGSNGSGDHNDWAAIDDNGIADFSLWNTSEANYDPGSGIVKNDNSKRIVRKGLSTKQAQEAKQKGTLGIVTRDGRKYDLKTKFHN